MRVRLIHWNPAEAAARVTGLQNAGFRIEYVPEDRALRGVREDPPDAVVIDLDRLPSHGREVALALRSHSATRRIPLVFAGGAAEKVERVKRALPDAAYATWEQAAEALADAIANPPENPVTPRANPAGYSGTPLPKKLGIKAEYTVLLESAPDGFEALLSDLPPGATLTRE